MVKPEKQKTPEGEPAGVCWAGRQWAFRDAIERRYSVAVIALIALMNFMVRGLSSSARAFATQWHATTWVDSDKDTQALNVTHGRNRTTAWMSPASSCASITGPIGL